MRIMIHVKVRRLRKTTQAFDAAFDKPKLPTRSAPAEAPVGVLVSSPPPISLDSGLQAWSNVGL